jgi:RNA polymerase sigma-70 factor (ECF subfamily)
MLSDFQPDSESLTDARGRCLLRADIPDVVASALADPSVLRRLHNAASAMLRAWHYNLPSKQRWAEAEEVVQEAARRALARRSAYDQERSIVPWLAGIVVKVCKERTRCRASGASSDSAAGPPDGALEDFVVDLSRTSEETMADRLDSRQILERLPPDDRHLLRLRFFEDASALEIGKQLGISEAAARVRLFRVLAKLRNQMAAEAEKQS